MLPAISRSPHLGQNHPSAFGQSNRGAVPDDRGVIRRRDCAAFWVPPTPRH